MNTEIKFKDSDIRALIAAYLESHLHLDIVTSQIKFTATQDVHGQPIVEATVIITKAI